MKRSASAFAVLLLTVAMGLVSVSAALPSGYTEVGWVQATGSQWVLSGYTPACTDRIEMKVRFLPAQYKNWTLFCARGTSATTATFTCYWLNYYLYFNRNTDASTVSTISLGSSFYDRVVVADGNTLTCSIDGVECQTMAGGSFDVGSELLFFASHTAGTNLNASTTVSNKGEFKFYYARIYNSSGTLVREYVPVRDDSAADGAVAQYGLYETTTSTFHPNIGTTAFYAPTIVRVTPDAAGGGNGKSWTVDGGGNGPMTLAEAYNAATNDTGDGVSILLKTGHYDLTEELAFSRGITMRGGYAGTDDVSFTSTDSVSVLDGQDTLSTLVKINHAPLYIETFERLEFTRAYSRAIGKGTTAYYGRGGLILNACRFTANGTRWATSYPKEGGRALYVDGSSAAWPHFVSISNCVFGGNAASVVNGYNCAGIGAVYLENVNRAMITDSTFVTNGVCWYYPVGPGSISTSGGGAAILSSATPTAITRCTFIGNRAVSTTGAASSSIVELINTSYSDWCCGVTNCLFIANESVAVSSKDRYQTPLAGALLIRNSASALTSSVDNCTFAYNLFDLTGGSAGLCIYAGSVKVRNSIFYGNRIAESGTYGCDLKLNESSSRADVDYTLFGSTSESNVYNVVGAQLNMGPNVQTGDPVFYSSLADFQSLVMTTNTPAAPTVNLSAFIPDDATLAKVLAMDAHIDSAISQAVDGGDPASDYAAEPDPNGGRVNLGAYGNTSEAHVTEAAQPSVDGDVSITFPYGTTQPKVSFVLGGDEGVEYNATVTISCSTNGTDFVVTKRLYGYNNGDSIDVVLPVAFVSGDSLFVRVVVSAPGVADVVPSIEPVVMQGSTPASFGKGGGAGIVHVRPGATGLGDGSNWFDAIPDICALPDFVVSGVDEIWIAGSNVCTRTKKDIVPTAALAIRGGFVGVENGAAERVDGTVSVIDGMDAMQPLTIINDAAVPVMIERLRISHAATSGLIKTGSGDLTLESCDFALNGLAMTGSCAGTGARITGGTNTLVCVTNCTFEGNLLGYGQWNYNGCCGSGLYIKTAKRVMIDDTLFVSNGIPLDAALADYRWSSWGVWGAAFYANSAPVTIRSCAFRANRGCALSYSTSPHAGIVALEGDCGGSAFTNCLWMGNQLPNIAANGCQPAGPTRHNGMVFLRLKEQAQTVDFANCTFALNFADTVDSPVGLNVVTGSVGVVNSVFYGNLAGERIAVGRDIAVSTGATARVAYTLFEGTNETFVTGAEPGAITWGGHILASNPLLVTPVSELSSRLLVYPFARSGVVYTNVYVDLAQAAIAVGFNAHLRGKQGYRDEATGGVVCFSEESPAIDAGDPASSFKNEAKPNGGRVNLGFYGNTSWATMSGGGSLLLLK